MSAFFFKKKKKLVSLGKIFSEIEKLLFPLYCLHCKKSVCKEQIFCDHCTEFFSLLLPDNRCKVCFSVECQSCKESYFFSAALFENEGPAHTLYNKAKKDLIFPYWDLFYSFLFWQIEQLQWSDIRTLYLSTFFSPFRGYVKKLGKELNVKSTSVLHKMKNNLLVVALDDSAKTKWQQLAEKTQKKVYFLSLFFHAKKY